MLFHYVMADNIFELPKKINTGITYKPKKDPPPNDIILSLFPD